MTCDVCTWIQEADYEYCQKCGAYRKVVKENIEENVEENVEDKCKHVWECLRDRCHNRGKGKYQAYKCKLCGKFQRR